MHIQILKSKRDIEFTYFKKIENAYKERGMDIGSFNTWPYFSGIMGTTLTPYSGSWKGR